MKAVPPKRHREHRWVGVVTTSLPSDNAVGAWLAAADTGATLAVEPAAPVRAYCIDCERVWEDVGVGERCTATPREHRRAPTNGGNRG